jgi:hypothetical protein
MFGLFGGKKQEQEAPEWLQQVHENKERFFAFLTKLEQKMDELGEASLPELKAAFNEETDNVYNAAYDRMLAGVKGQFENMRQKAYDVNEEKVIDFERECNDSIEFDSPYRDVLHDFRTTCSDRYHQDFTKKYESWIKKLDETGIADLEAEYNKIIKDFEATKDKFTCKQCGSKITIEKIFTLDVYVTCGSCQTQNTFQPSTLSKSLENIAQNLAMDRAAEEYYAYENCGKIERELYHARHELKLSKNFENDKKIVAQAEVEIEELERRRQEAIANEPIMYEKFIRRKYAEWIKIMPDQERHLLIRMQNELNHP